MTKGHNFIIPAVAVLASLMSCTRDDIADDYVMGKIYIRQCAVSAGVADYDYTVPADPNSGEIHHTLDEASGDIIIPLGVMQDGTDALPYDVRIISDRLIAEAGLLSYSNAVVLDEEYYELPGSVSVPEGEKGEDFELRVDLDRMTEDFPTGSGMTFIIGIRISDPTDYELNTDRNRILIIIDGSTFIPESSYIHFPDATPENGYLTIPPTDGSHDGYTFDETEFLLTIPLTVARSESEADVRKDVTVTLTSGGNSLEGLAEAIGNCTVLPDEYYSIPETVTIAADVTSATFGLTVDFDRIVEERPALATGKFLVSANISSVSEYVINESMDNVTILIDASEFELLPEEGNMLQGGQFKPRDAEYWTMMNNSPDQDVPVDGQFEISDGVLKLDVTKTRTFTCSQAVEITEPGRYRVDVDFYNAGTAPAWSSRVYVMFSKNAPVARENYFTKYRNTNPYCVIEQDPGKIDTPTDGVISLTSSTWEKLNGFPADCVFDIQDTGTYWFVIGMSSWSVKESEPLEGYFDNAYVGKAD